MKAVYANDAAQGPGHGFLLISEAGPLAASEGLRFCIKRASDRSCLGRDGWQAAEIFLTPEALVQDGGNFQITVGPSVVDNLDARETYRITLMGAEGAREQTGLHVSEVIYSPLSGGQGIGSIAAPKTPEPALPPVEEPKPAPIPEAETPTGLKEIPEAAMEMPAASSKQSSGKSALPLILLVLALLLAGGGFAAWKLTSDAEPAPEPPMAQARKHLSGDADPAIGFALAKTFRQQEQGADAAFLLAEDAAQKGHAPAMIMSGDFYSPIDSAPHGSIRKDALEAFTWYTRAQEAGAAEAAARLDGLRAWAEAEAAKGSAEADGILRKFVE